MRSKPSIAVSRRKFLGTAATTAAVFNFFPSHVLGLGGSKSPNEKLNVAGIGVSGQGGSDLSQFTSENIVALCDVDWAHAAGTFKKFPNAKQYKDYRKMLEEQKDIDAVIVATPDHHHAFASMMALKLGKHVYCEKPLTHSVWEARQIGEAARKLNLATQMGNQGQASEETRKLCEMIWDGAIGNVREVHAWTDRPANGLFNEYWPQGIPRPSDTAPIPSTLDWEMWLGPAPSRPYNPAYLPFKWRGWWDFGTGALGDIGCHSLDSVFRALKLGAPISVEASSSRVNEETYPLASMVTYEFAGRENMPPVTLTWYDGGLRPPRPAEMDEGMPSTANEELVVPDKGKNAGLRQPDGDARTMGTNGKLIIGDKGKIITQGMRYVLIPKSLRESYGEPPKKLPRSIGHYKEFIEACKGGPKPGSNFEFAGALTEAVLLGNVALRVQLREKITKAKLLWDSKNLQVTNMPEANKFIRREYRAGWNLA